MLFVIPAFFDAALFSLSNLALSVIASLLKDCSALPPLNDSPLKEAEFQSFCLRRSVNEASDNKLEISLLPLTDPRLFDKSDNVCIMFPCFAQLSSNDTWIFIIEAPDPNEPESPSSAPEKSDPPTRLFNTV